MDKKKLITIFVTGNEAEAAIVRGLLEDSGIPCVVLNDGLQNLFGIGQFGTGFNPIIGAIKIQVPEEFEEDARMLLEQANGEEEPAENDQ